MPDNSNIRTTLQNKISTQKDDLISIAQSLVKAASPNPPGNTTQAADTAINLLQEHIPNIHISRHETAPGIVNVFARISSHRPGKRLIFNGHLDTYPICEHLNWTVPPLGAVLSDGRLYGRGVSDMKAGIASSIMAVKILAEHPDLWAGEIVITLAGDEETMGEMGTKWMLDNVEGAVGDVMICGDVGSPRVVRFGEKGFVWVDVEAEGVAAHGAHVHKGVNAINRLRGALDAIQRLEDIDVSTPDDVGGAIDSAMVVSESLSGHGETDTLRHVTVNIGTVNAGVSPNLVPSHAKAQIDIRLPVGVSTSLLLDQLAQSLDPMEGVTWRAIRKFEPNYTPPGHEFVELALSVCGEVMRSPAVANMRVGASDSRLYRAAGIPTVVVGCTPYNMGNADEYVMTDELVAVAQIHTLMAFDFLKQATD